MTEFDIARVSKFLDPHLLIPVLEFARQTGKYDNKEVLQWELQVCARSNMVDLSIEKWKELNPGAAVPAEYNKKREAVVATRKRLREQCQPLLDILNEKEKTRQMIEEKVFTPLHLKESHPHIKSECFEALIPYCKCAYECGDYESAAKYLPDARALGGITVDDELSCLWGALSSEVLRKGEEEGEAVSSNALDALAALRDQIDLAAQSSQKSTVTIQQRIWLMHWALFACFTKGSDVDHITDLFLSDAYMQVIQTAAPHLLRYLSVAIVINNKKKKYLLAELENVLKLEEAYYSDPVTSFIESVLVKFDFDKAQQQLEDCEKLLENDFFLRKYSEAFMENARLLVFKTYCSIHHTVEISQLAQRLRMDRDSAERWVGSLIRTAELDARIDSRNNSITMGPQSQSVYQTVIDKTKSLAYRTFVLSSQARGLLRKPRNSRDYSQSVA